MSQQQPQQLRYSTQEKDEVVTQADTLASEQNISLIERAKEFLAVFEQTIVQQYQILTKINEGTFSSDKILRLISSLCKIIKNFQFLKNLKCIDFLSGQIGQLRRLLRYDRILMIIKEQISNYRKGKLGKVDKAMVIFKLIILFSDFNDILSYLIQAKVVKNDKWLPALRTNVANIYFLECMGWLIYHSYEYLRSKSEESKQKNKMMIIKYSMDAFTSHNDFTHRLFTVDSKLISLVGACSSVLNLSLAWK